MENNNINASSSEPVVWPTNTEQAKKKGKLKVVYLVLAVLLTLGSALGSFYLSKNLNQASTPNAPESRPQAATKPASAGKNQITLNTQGNGCEKGCGSNEYCSGGECHKTGGTGDSRTLWQQYVQSIPIATPTEQPSKKSYGYELIPGYICSAANCPGPNFACRDENICENLANPGMTVANDILNCGGTGKYCQNVGEACIGGQCVIPDKYECKSSNCDYGKGFKCFPEEGKSGQCVLNSVTSVTPTLTRPTVSIIPGSATTSLDNPANCGASNIKCAVGVQKCENGKCVSVSTATKACDGILPDQTIEVFNGQRINTAHTKTCCVPRGTGIGVIPAAAFENETNLPDPSIGQVVGSLDTRAHWTNCAAGTTCRQGVGCIGSGTKTPEKTTTEITTVTTVTTTVTATPSITVTTSPTATPTATITVTVTSTPSGTVTTTPTPATCNESCSVDSDCNSGLFCDSESNKCRKTECSSEKDCSCPEVTPEETPEPTIVGCNYKCKTDDNCSSGLICDGDSGRCRKAACSDEKDCNCPKPRKTDAPTREVTRTSTRTAAQPTILKEAGILDLPGVAVFGSGLILTVIGILLAL